MHPDRLFGADLGTPLRIAIQMLLRAKRYADDTRTNAWDFAVEIVELQRAGVSMSELRWLVTSQYALHALEVPSKNGAGRKFRRLQPHVFPSGTCFVLSERGVAMLQAVAAGSARQHALLSPGQLSFAGDVEKPVPDVGSTRLLPLWDSQQRRLCFRNLIVKQFRCRALNQECVLAAFQDEAWSTRIDDPLPQRPGCDPRRRLHDAIKCLNRNQLNPLIRFRGDGSGRGILWEPR